MMDFITGSSQEILAQAELLNTTTKTSLYVVHKFSKGEPVTQRVTVALYNPFYAKSYRAKYKIRWIIILYDILATFFILQDG